MLWMVWKMEVWTLPAVLKKKHETEYQICDKSNTDTCSKNMRKVTNKLLSKSIHVANQKQKKGTIITERTKKLVTECFFNNSRPLPNQTWARVSFVENTEVVVHTFCCWESKHSHWLYQVFAPAATQCKANEGIPLGILRLHNLSKHEIQNTGFKPVLQIRT